MSIRDFVFGPNAATGSVEAPARSELGAARREAIPTSFGAGEFPSAVERLLAREGGYSDNPADRGGKTNFGISSGAYPNLDVSKLTREQAAEIYKRDYWDAIGADQLDPRVREIAFDAAVNHGVGTAKRLLAEAGDDPKALIAARRRLYDQIVAKDPSQAQFREGWENRLAGLESGEGQTGGYPPLQRPAQTPQRSAAWQRIMGSDLPLPQEEGEVSGMDFAKGLAITGMDFAKAPVAALENLAGQVSRNEGEAGIYGAVAQGVLGDVRRSIGEWQKGFFDSMSPESLSFAQRELLTLDPNKTMWQGGPKEFLTSLALKGTLSLGPTIGPMITTALLSRMGVGAAASTLYGAQEGLMSAGLTAASIADNIEQTPIEELRKVDRFRALEAQAGEAEARRQFINEVQGIVPAVTGILVGSIAKMVGKPLDKIFGTGEGLPLLQRIGAGATTEALQEGPQSFSEQVLQNYAEMAYKSDVNLLDGAAEQTVQGMLLGGIMGGTFAGAFGNRPQNNVMSSDPVPADLRQAIGGGAPPATPAATPPTPPAGPAIGGGAIPTEPPAGPPPSTTPTLDAFNAPPPWDPNAPPPQAPAPELFGDNVLADEVNVPPVEETLAPFPKNRAKVPKLADTYGIPEFAMEQEAAAQAAAQEAAAREAETNPLGLSPDGRPVEADIAAALGALPISKPPKGTPKWAETAAPVDLDAVLAKDAAKQKPPSVEPSSLPPMQEEQRGFEVNQTREPKHGIRTRTEQLGYRVRMRGPNGEILSSELFETATRARLKAHQMERGLRGTNDGRRVEVLPARRTFLNDQTPTAEPVSDVMAQIRDMNSRDALDLRMDSDQRRAVYLTRETLENLQEAGQLDQALRGGIPIRNFDTYGGILLARDEDTAQELMQLIEDPKSNIDEVIGYATGAGDGKPGGNNPVVQLLDADGNVIRERQVTPEEVEPTLQKWGPGARVMPLEQALAIRHNRMQREKAERNVAREQQAFNETRPDQQVEEMFNENPMTQPFAEQAKQAAQEGGFEEDIAGRITDMAVEQRAQELKRRKLDKNVPAPEDVKFRGREVVEKSREETRLRREGKKEEADKIRSSIGGSAPKRDELSKAYRELYGRATDAAIKVMEAKLNGSTQDVTDAEAEYDTLLDELKAFYGMEGGYTKAEAIQRASERYSPKGKRETLRALARAREERKAKAEAKEEESMEAVREAREWRARKQTFYTGPVGKDEKGRDVFAGRSERIIARNDTAREERKLRNIVEGSKVTVEAAAARLQHALKRTSTPEGQRLTENLFMMLSPSVGKDLDQVVEAVEASKELARLEGQRKAGTIGEQAYQRRKRIIERKTREAEEKHRTAVANAVLEINQLLRQWLSDYRLALRYAVPADGKENRRRDGIQAARAAEVAEMLGNLKAYHQGDIKIADDAARYLAHRISRMVVLGKRLGVSTEMDIDGFWEAIDKGPMAFRDYLADTVQSREDLPFPTDLTMETLEQVSLGTLNALYVKAVEHLDGSRESDGQRREIVKALKKAIADRGVNLSDEPQTIEVEVWDRKAHEYVKLTRSISPRKLMAETFRRSYGLRGADSRMGMDQLKELYLKGGEITVWENGYVEFDGEGKHPVKLVKKGKAKKIKLEPLGDKLPEALPLNVFARRLPPEKKRKIIMRAVRNMDRKQHGGKSQSTGLARTAKSDSPRTRAATKYNTGVLLEDTAPRELSEKKSVEYTEQKLAAEQSLSDSLSNAAAYLAQLDSAKFKKAAGNAQGLIHAKAYFRWLVEFGQTLANAKLKSYAAFKEMHRVATDIEDITKLQPEQFVAEIEKRFRAEMNEQIFRTVSLDPLNLKGLSDPKQRAKITAESHDRVRKVIMFHKRLTEIWPSHPIFLQDVQPVLNKIAESIAVRHRGDYQESRGWPIATFTDEERKRVMAVLEDWKTAKDKPQAEKRRIWQAWGVPADTLYDDFYLPLHEMLQAAGFIDPDVALLKHYNRRFTSLEDQSTGPVDVLLETESEDDRLKRLYAGDETPSGRKQRRFASVQAPDPVAAAAAELDRRKQEMRDRELVAMDDDDAIELNPAERERRKKLMSSPLGKTAVSARKLLSGNDSIARFRRVLENPDASVRQIEMAEARMLNELAEAGLYRVTSKGLGTIGLPDTAPIIEQIEKEQADLQKAMDEIERESPDSDEFSTEPLLSGKRQKEVERLAAELQESRRALAEVTALRLGNKKARTVAYRSVGDRLVSGELTKAQARLAAGEKLSGFWVKAEKAQRLGREKSKTRGDEMKDRAKAAAAEQKRREGMSYEQRRAVESLDRLHGPAELNFDLTAAQNDYGKASGAEYEAFFAIRDRLASSESVQLGELLAFVSDKLGEGHAYQPIIRKLLTHASHRRVPVRFSPALPEKTTGKLALVGGSPVILLNEDAFMQTGFNPLRAIHVVLHEAVHAATVRQMTDNQPALDALDMLRKLARERLGGKHLYATSDVFEFVAEAYTNAEFQRALKSINVSDVNLTPLWNRFVDWVMNLLGFAPQYENMLDAVMSLQSLTFGPGPYNSDAAAKVKSMQPAEGGTSDYELAFRDSALAQNEQVQELLAHAKAMADTGKEGGSSLLLKALSMRQIAQIYDRHFGSKVNPLRDYMKAFEARNSYSSELLEDADKLSRRWTALEEADQKAKTHHAVELSRLMHDATVEGVHADQAGTSLNARFQSLSPEAQKLYREIREYYKATQKREVQLMLANALRASKLWPGGDIDHETIDLEGIAKGDWLEKKLGIDIKAQEAALEADADTLDRKTYKAREADIENTKEELKLISRMASIPSMKEGPYFPLMRFGDYAVSAERVVKTEIYATRKERTDAMAAWTEQDPTLQFSFPETDDGTFPLTVKEVEFRLAETRTEAEAARQDLMKLYEGGEVSSVQLKQSLMSSSPTIESNSALQTLLGKLRGNAAAQAAIREFYIKSLSDRSFRKREARRKNIRGADPTMQHRTFGAYSKSASYYTAQLRYGHVMAAAKADMRKVVKGHTDESKISAVKMGQIVREIETRDDQAAKLTDTPKFVRAAVETGQLWLLLSPSYWIINATQPYMVTIPWLAARSNLPDATAEMARAQKLILDPLVTQGIESWGGLKALKSRLAAEKAFSVLENVTGSIEKRMREQGQDPQPVLDMLTALKRESIIDLSFVAELRDIAEGQEQGAWNKVMDASRVLAHLTEVNNRITTAIAAFNLAKKQGLSDVDATSFAKNAVAETQFDYSAANKPRLFSANDAWWKPVVFQFMQYVQHMYVLFVRHFAMMMRDPFAKVGEAAIGRRVVLGLLATHMAAGGLLGATPQLAKWAIGLVMALLGAGDDDDRTFKNWASGEYYNRMMSDAVAWLAGDGKVGEMARAGLPRGLGFDLSSRTAFLQTYMIDLNTESKETLYGSLVTSFGGPMFGIFGNAFDAVELMAQGDADKAAEKLLPKLGRDAIRAWRYSSEGMVDHTGKTIVGAGDMSPWEIFLTSMGFQPSQIAEVYARNTRARGAETFVSKRKAEIMAQYRKARSTGEMGSVMADLREFNKQFPQDRITISQLLRGMRDMRRAEMNIQRFGVDAGRRSSEYTDDTYNVE